VERSAKAQHGQTKNAQESGNVLSRRKNKPITAYKRGCFAFIYAVAFNGPGTARDQARSANQGDGRSDRNRKPKRIPWADQPRDH